MITVYGSSVAAYARRLPPDLDVLLCDGSDAARALADGVTRRRHGRPFYVAPLLIDSQALLARSTAGLILGQHADEDQRRVGFEALSTGNLVLGEHPIAQLSCYTIEVLSTMRELMQMGDGLLVRSQHERHRLEQLFQRQRRYVAIAPYLDPTVPDISADPYADRVVVWAPHESAEALTIYGYALGDLHRPAIFVCQGTFAGTRHEFLPPERGIEALRQAAVIVDTQLADPGTALAFAGRGFGLATAVTSGAHEYIQGATLYRPGDFRSIAGSVARARGDRRAFALAVPQPTAEQLQQILDASQPVIPDNAPSVSIVIPTYNRPQYLRTRLEDFRRQQYPNLEVIVVNDAGDSVDHIVAEYPFARVITMPENSKSVKAVNAGMRSARGEFVGLLADDDADYPTQLAYLVQALTHSGLDVAHGNIVMRLNTTLADGRSATYGHRLDHDGDHDRTEAYWVMKIHCQGYLMRRKAFEAIGFLDERLICTSDFDCTLRLSDHYDFAHADAVTGEMEYRDDRSNQSGRAGEALVWEIRDMLITHTPPERELILQRQRMTLQCVHEGQQRASFFVPWIPLDQPIPIERDTVEHAVA